MLKLVNGYLRTIVIIGGFGLSIASFTLFSVGMPKLMSWWIAAVQGVARQNYFVDKSPALFYLGMVSLAVYGCYLGLAMVLNSEEYTIKSA